MTKRLKRMCWRRSVTHSYGTELSMPMSSCGCRWMNGWSILTFLSFSFLPSASSSSLPSSQNVAVFLFQLFNLPSSSSSYGRHTPSNQRHQIKRIGEAFTLGHKHTRHMKLECERENVDNQRRRRRWRRWWRRLCLHLTYWLNDLLKPIVVLGDPSERVCLFVLDYFDFFLL